MHDINLILTLTAGMAAALVLGYITHRLGLSPIVGYLLAGIVVGPTTPGFVADRHMAEQMAEVGVILLMFGVGLHFHIEELLAVRKIAITGAVGQSLVATVMGAVVAFWLGWGWVAGIVFGLALSVASTVVLTRVLSDNNVLHTPTGHIAVGWLVVEDIFTVLVLVLLPPLLSGEGAVWAVGMALLKFGLLAAIVVPVGGRVIPWLLNRVTETGSRELFTLTVLVVALGIAVGSSLLFGVSMALGAFLAGMIVGRSEFSLRAATDALPMRDAFAVLFFVSVGMLFNLGHLIESPWPVILTLIVVMVGKPAAALAIVLLLGYPVSAALSVAVALAQIGEFSFILANLGMSLGVLPGEASSTLVAAAIVSIAANPLIFKTIKPIEAWLARQPWLWRFLTARVRERTQTMHGGEEKDPRYRAVVIGYGPVGQTLVRLLRENGITPIVIEMNVETVRRLRAEGTEAVYGDAIHPTTFEEAKIDKAETLILSASGVNGAEEVVRLARQLNPDIRVLARSAYLRERAPMRAAGADEVYAGEGEVALAMAESVLRELGAGPEQIDRERERVRADLFGDPRSEKKPGKQFPTTIAAVAGNGAAAASSANAESSADDDAPTAASG